MVQYNYRGETFQVTDTGAGELTVSNGEGTHWIVVRGTSHLYEITNESHKSVDDGGLSPEDAVERACQLLQRDRTKFLAPEDRKAALSDFVHRLRGLPRS